MSLKKTWVVAASLSAWVFVCLASGAIHADEKGTPIKGWGQAFDPDGDCQIVLKDQSLAMAIPGKGHDYAADIATQNAPRVLREVRGDFIVDVRVGGEISPGNVSTVGGRLPYHGGGLLLIKDQDNYISLHRGCVFINQTQRHYANFELRKEGRLEISKYEIEIPNQDTYLRLERRGNLVFNATSPDGIHWSSYDPIELEMPEALQLGVVGISSSTVPLDLKFHDLKIYQKVAVE